MSECRFPCNCKAHSISVTQCSLHKAAPALLEALDYMVRYYETPEHAKLSTDCPNKHCPICKAMEAIAAAEREEEADGEAV